MFESYFLFSFSLLLFEPYAVLCKPDAMLLSYDT
jgi:hypothetical protein